MKEIESEGLGYNLRPLWDSLLSIYKEVADICKRYDIRYFVDGGTMLGAVRHQGFIPWDDDFDLRMLQSDVTRFRDVASRELPDNLKIVDWRNTPEYPNLFIKVHETRQNIIEAIEKQSGLCLNQGVFIDIFPITGYPNTGSAAKLLLEVLQKSLVFFWRHSSMAFMTRRLCLNITRKLQRSIPMIIVVLVAGLIRH